MKESHIKMYCRLREGPAFKNNTLENYAAEKTKKIFQVISYKAPNIIRA